MSLYMEEEGGLKLPFNTEDTANLVIEAALEYEGCPYEAEINLLLTTDEDIRDMNQMFRQITPPSRIGGRSKMKQTMIMITRYPTQ